MGGFGRGLAGIDRAVGRLGGQEIRGGGPVLYDRKKG